MATTFLGCGVEDTSFTTASSTRYASFGDSAVGNWVVTTEAEAAITCRVPGTLSKLRANVKTNTRGTSTTVTVMQNGSASSLAVSVGASTTGVISDTTNSVSLADGDTYSLRMVTGTGGGNFQCFSADAQHVPNSGSAKQFSSQRSVALASNSVTRGYSVCGRSPAESTESNAFNVAPVDLTMSKMQVYVSANTRSSTTTYDSRNNGGTGNQSVSVATTLTGLFEDASNTDSVTAGNTFNVLQTTGGGSGTITTARVGMVVATDGAGFPVLACEAVNSVTDPHYGHVLGENYDTTTEADHAYDIPFALTASKMGVRVASNGSATTTTIRLRVDGANGNQAIAITSGSTGSFRDTSSSDSVAANQDVNFSVTGHTTGSLSIRTFSMFMSEVVAGGAAVGFGLTRGLRLNRMSLAA